MPYLAPRNPGTRKLQPMKAAFLLIFCLLLPLGEAVAQGVSGRNRPQQPAAVVSFMPTYQRWADGDTVYTQQSMPLFAQAALGSGVGISLAAGQARVSGDEVASLSGLTDVQVGFSYRRKVGAASAALSLGVNLPSGKKAFTDEEFLTSIILSEDFFRFQVSRFGQGFNLSPGLTVAVPAGEGLVLGFGVAYQVLGAYKPLDTLDDDYNPGDELRLTGGVDVRVTPTANVSLDLTYTRYGVDVLGDAEVFGSGDKLTASLQYRQAIGFDEVWLFGRYRSRAKNEVAVSGLLVEEVEKTIPDQVELLGHYRRRFSSRLQTRFLAEARFAKASPQRDAVSLIGLGLSPELTLSPAVSLLLRVKYFFGSFTGLEAGLGLSFRLQ